ncbi:hypothetical protein OIU78_029240, partial [Salix suchowensis]
MYLYKYISQQLISPGSISHDSVEWRARDARNRTTAVQRCNCTLC